MNWQTPNWSDPREGEATAKMGDWRYEIWNYGSYFSISADYNREGDHASTEVKTADEAKQWCANHYREWYNSLPKPEGV